VSSDARAPIDAELSVRVTRWDGNATTDTAARTAGGAAAVPRFVPFVTLHVPAQGGASAALNASQLAAMLAAAGCGAAAAAAAECFVSAQLTAAEAVGSSSSSSAAAAALSSSAAAAPPQLLAPEIHQWLGLWRDLQLAPARLFVEATAATTTVTTVTVTVWADAVAPAVMVHCRQPSDFGVFSDNGLLLLPGQNVTLTCEFSW
jgi:hypothetical protein